MYLYTGDNSYCWIVSSERGDKMLQNIGNVIGQNSGVFSIVCFILALVIVFLKVWYDNPKRKISRETGEDTSHKKRSRWFWLVDIVIGIATMIMLPLLIMVIGANHAEADRQLHLSHSYDQANQYFDDGRFDLAEQEWKELVKEVPGSADYRYGYAKSLEKSGKYADAVEQCEQALIIDPDNAEYWNRKAVCLYQQGYYEEALKSAQEAYNLAPDVMKYKLNLVFYYILLEQYADARDLCENACEAIQSGIQYTTDEKTKTFLYYGQVLDALGEYSSAKVQFEKAMLNTFHQSYPEESSRG